MKIKEVTEDLILFDNENTISSYHPKSCCEYNYALFTEIEDIALDYEFDEDLVFEKSSCGFRFGNKDGLMFFIPCYTEQNGYYSDEVSIYYDEKCVIEDQECNWKTY